MIRQTDVTAPGWFQFIEDWENCLADTLESMDLAWAWYHENQRRQNLARAAPKS